MPPETPPLPPKPEVALALLQSAPSIYIHLDPRGDDVGVPSHFKTQAQLVLQVGMNMAVPIPDLEVGEEGISCTLSFNRRPEFCMMPWDAIYGLVGEDGRGMIWPDSVPPEVAAAAEGRAQESKPKRAHLRVAGEESQEEGTPQDEPNAEASREEQSAAPVAQPTTSQEESAPQSEAAAPSLRSVPPEVAIEADQLGAAPAEPSASDSKEEQKAAETASPERDASDDEPGESAESPQKTKKGRELPSYLRVVK